MEKNYIKLSSQLIPEKLGLINKGREILRFSTLSLLSKISYHKEVNFLRCLYLHNVFDDQIEKFENFIIKLLDIGTFINSNSLEKMINGEIPIENRYFHLSFDDGFNNNYTNVMPILLKYNIPCLFFIPTDIIGADWERTKSYCLKTTYYGGVIQILDWQQIEEMAALGFEIGSHTKSHARLSKISYDYNLLHDEVFGSKDQIEKKIGINCKYISWPYGRHNDIDKKALDMVINSGYNACFGAFRGSVIKNKTNIFKIPRHDIDLQLPISHNEYFARGNMELEFKF